MENDDPQKQTEDLLKSINEAKKRGDAAAVERLSFEFMAAASALVDPNDPGILASRRADELANEGQFDEAENYYKKSLEIYSARGRTNSHVEGQLVGLYRMLDRNADALAAARAAEARYADAPYGFLRVKPLPALAGCALSCGDLSTARDAITRALHIINLEKSQSSMMASLLVLRAEYLLKSNDPIGCGEDLQTAREILNHSPLGEWAAGYQSTYANLSAGTARLHEDRKDYLAAVEAWREAVKRREWVANAPQLAGPYAKAGLARTLRGLARALILVKSEMEAKVVLERANYIRAKIWLAPFPGAE